MLGNPRGERWGLFQVLLAAFLPMWLLLVMQTAVQLVGYGSHGTSATTAHMLLCGDTPHRMPYVRK